MTIENHRQKKEIRVFGIRRSGNHAIISWLIDNYPGSVVFVNNINHHNQGNFPASPFDVSVNRPFVDRIIVKGLPYWRCKNKLAGLIKYVITRPSQFAFVPSDNSVDINYIRQVKKDALIYSFEDIQPNDSRLNLFDQELTQYIGNSQKKINLIILRDPFNLFASLLKSKMMNKNDEDKFKYISLFKGYAREYIDQIDQKINIKNDSDHKIFVSYNQWFSEANYRIELAEKLGFAVIKDSYQKISDRGQGSSFDSFKYENQASSMKVIERWKVFKDDLFYKSLFEDRDLLELSQIIFNSEAPKFLGL